MKQFLPIFFFLCGWIEMGNHCFGQEFLINGNQGLIARLDTLKESLEVSIAAAKLLPSGTEVTVEGILTVADQLGGPAFLQDESGGIPVYDNLLHGHGKYTIGDRVKLSAKLDQFNEQVQLVDISYLEFLGPGEAIQPKRVSIDSVAKLEGLLVTISAAEFLVPKGLLYPETNYPILDATGSMDLRIDGDVHELPGRFVPTTPQNITGVLGSFGGNLHLLPRLMEDLPGTLPYLEGGSNISTEETLDIMTWNMEFFGATLPGFGPSDVRLQMQNALRILQDSKPDIVAVQEVSDTNLLGELIGFLPGYALYCSDRFSRSSENLDPSFPPQRLCFLYKKEVIALVSDKPLFETLYDEVLNGGTDALDDYPTGTASSFWSSGRLPYMVEVEAKIQDTIERIIFINIHAKSGANNMDLDRKKYDIQMLKDSLDVFYPDNNIVLLGDFNDDLDESIGGGASTYEVIVHDANYIAISLSLSEAGLSSYIYDDHMIDHIILSNELSDNYLVESAQLYIPFSTIDNYAQTTSDHLPVIARLLPGSGKQTMEEKQDMFTTAKIIKYYPNPFLSNIKIILDQSLSLPIKVSLHDTGGKVIFGGLHQVVNGECDLDLKGLALRPGVYFLHLTFGKESKIIRLVKK